MCVYLRRGDKSESSAIAPWLSTLQRVSLATQLEDNHTVTKGGVSQALKQVQVFIQLLHRNRDFVG